METERIYARQLEHSDVGLPAHIAHQTYAQGRIDTLTLGCSAVKSVCHIHEDGALRSLDMRYWYRTPDNNALDVSLFHIKAAQSGIIDSLTVAGRAVSLSQPAAIEAALQAIRYIHDDLKEGRYPNIAGAFTETALSKHIGKTIKIIGQKETGEPDFSFSALFNLKAAGYDTSDIILPQDPILCRALIGLSSNPLRQDMDIAASSGRIVPAFEPLTLTTYENCLKIQERKDNSLSVRLAIHRRGDDESKSIEIYKNFFQLAIKGGVWPKITNISLMGKDLTGRGHNAQAKALGVCAGMLQLMARQMAPVPIQQLIKFDLRNAMTDPALLQAMDGGDNPFLRISLAGNRYTKLYGPYGSDLGNCTLLMHSGVTILHDFAFKPAPDGEKSTGAIPSIQDWLPQLDVLCATHRHIDHIGGIPYENFKGKKILATPQVIEAIKDSMRTLHGSKAKLLMPDFVPLTEDGHYTISHDNGKSGITILFSPNAIPHTAYCTPFYYAAFDTRSDGTKYIKAVYANFGDVRDEATDPSFDLSQPLRQSDWWWFKQGWQQHLFAAHPDLDIADIPSRPTFAEWDSTSVRYQDETPQKADILKNMKMVASWFDGRPIIAAHLASSDNQFDIMLQTAAATGRNFTTFGKNMEVTQRIQNIFGYSELNQPWAQGHQNQIRMDDVHKEYLNRKLEGFAPDYKDFNTYMDIKFGDGLKFRGNKRKQFTLDLNEEDRSDFEHFLEWKKFEKKKDFVKANPHKLYLFHKWAFYAGHKKIAESIKIQLCSALHERLMEYSNNYWRYNLRKVYAKRFEIDDIRDLGAIAITRATRTSAQMFTDMPGQIFVSITGSQGNEVEIEAQLPKFLEKRSLLNLDPRYRHTARPIAIADLVLFITQPAIPSNVTARQNLIKKAVRDYGMIVVNATHDSLEIYNTNKLSQHVLAKIYRDLSSAGQSYKEEPTDHKLIVTGVLPIGYRGHGREQDISNWMERTQAEVNGPQHINDPEAARKVDIIAKSLHLGSVPLVADFEIASLNRFERLPEKKVQVRGSIPAAITILRQEHPHQKPYRPVIHRHRYTVIEPSDKPSILQPLMAGSVSRTQLVQNFGSLNMADAIYAKHTDINSTRPGSKPAPSDIQNLFSQESWGRRPTVLAVPAPATETMTMKQRSIELV